MAIVSLLQLPLTVRARWAFVFEHDQAHRRWTRQLQKKNLPHMTRLFDPMQHENLPASLWHLNHQLAHQEVTTGPPSKTGQILADSNLFRLRQKRWWEFANHHEHWRNQRSV